jgi:crossover junction endodeoxyribonuclease RuvC
MIILGIDPGTATTGIGILEFKKSSKKQLACLYYGVISTPTKMSMPERLNLLYDNLLILIKEYRPEAVAIESLFFFKNAKTVMAVSQARGVALLACAQKKVPIFEFTPLQAKIAVPGYGRAEMQKMIQKILELEKIPKPDDAADALALAICCSRICNFKLSIKN